MENKDRLPGEEEVTVPILPVDAATARDRRIAELGDALAENLYDNSLRAEQEREYTVLRIERDGPESVPAGALPGANPYRYDAIEMIPFQAESIDRINES